MEGSNSNQLNCKSIQLANKTQHIGHKALLYWFTIEGDIETQIPDPDQRGKIVNGPQKLPALEKIRDILEILVEDSKIEQYVCAYECGTAAVISVNIVYLRCVQNKKVIKKC